MDNWDTASIRRRQPRLVLDIASSSAAPFFPSLVEKLGVEVITVTTPFTSTGRFTLQHSVPASAARVGEIVLATEADVGAVLDPGAERLYVVDDKGARVPDSSLLLLLLEAAAIEAGAGTVTLPVHATRWAETVVAATGVEVQRTKYSNGALLAETGGPKVVFAANAEGGYAYPLVLSAMDGLYSLGKVLELVAKRGVSISQMIAKAPRAHIAHVLLECPWNLKGAVMRRLTAELTDANISLIDGVKVSLPKDDWALVLPDSEEALFHVYAEAGDDKHAESLAESYRGRLARIIAEAGGA